MTQEEWFAVMAAETTRLHDLSHSIERFESDQSRAIGELFGQLVDVLEQVTNSASWGDRRFHDFDKSGFAREYEDKIAHRLERE